MIDEKQAGTTGVWAKGGLWTALLAGVVVFGSATWRWLRPAPPLPSILRLVASGRYDEAHPRLVEYLQYDHSNPEARLAMAEILLSRRDETPESRARQALDYLDEIHFANPQRQAVVLVLQGKAHDALHEIGRAEACYSRALNVDPDVAEAGWLLLQTYYLEGRHDEICRLALRLFRNEPDRRDRVRLLLEPCRPDAQPLSSAGAVAVLEKARTADPDDRASTIAYFRALAGDGNGVDKALSGMQAFVKAHPDDLVAWDSLLECLESSGQLDEVEATLNAIPKKFQAEIRIEKHQARLAMERRDFPAAIRLYRKVIAARPYEVKSLHRLADALKFSGNLKESEEMKKREADCEAARLELRGVQGPKDSLAVMGAFQTALSQPNLGLRPDLPLYREFAAIRERMGHPEEASAWHQLILETVPDDAVSRAELERLERQISRGEKGATSGKDSASGLPSGNPIPHDGD